MGLSRDVRQSVRRNSAFRRPTADFAFARAMAHGIHKAAHFSMTDNRHFVPPKQKRLFLLIETAFPPRVSAVLYILSPMFPIIRRSRTVFRVDATSCG